MRFLLILRVSAGVLEKLTGAERATAYAEHREFQRLASEAGELISTQSLADPSTSTVVRASGGVPAVVATAPTCAADEFMGGYYLVDVDSRQRAIELASLLPDARVDGHAVEIRPVMISATPDF